jgi:hypothetical protein
MVVTVEIWGKIPRILDNSESNLVVKGCGVAGGDGVKGALGAAKLGGKEEGPGRSVWHVLKNTLPALDLFGMTTTDSCADKDEPRRRNATRRIKDDGGCMLARA